MDIKTFTFLIVAKSPCGDLREIAKSVPKGADLTDGDIWYYWSTKSAHIGTAISRAGKQLERLENKTSLDWEIDDDITIECNGRQEGFSLGDAELL